MAQLLRKSITPGKNIYMTPRIGMVAQKQKMIHRLVNHEGSVYSAIHKAVVRPAAVQNDLRRSFLPAAPIDSQWTLFCSTGIIPGKPVEQP